MRAQPLVTASQVNVRTGRLQFERSMCQLLRSINDRQLDVRRRAQVLEQASHGEANAVVTDRRKQNAVAGVTMISVAQPGDHVASGQLVTKHLGAQSDFRNMHALTRAFFDQDLSVGQPQGIGNQDAAAMSAQNLDGSLQEGGSPTCQQNWCGWRKMRESANGILQTSQSCPRGQSEKLTTKAWF